MHYFTPQRCQQSHKIMYAQKLQALRAAEDSWVQRGVRLWVYQCAYCGTWHLTHDDPAAYAAEHSYFNNATRKPRRRKRGYKPRSR